MGKDITDINVLKEGNKDAWKAEYNGHTILVVNTSVKATLEIDGVEQDKSLSLVNAVLKGELPEGESVIVFLESKMLEVAVHMVIGNEVKMQSGVVNKENEFRSADEDDTYLAQIHLTK